MTIQKQNKTARSTGVPSRRVRVEAVVICEDGMNKKELRVAFSEVLNAVENMRCENLHHAKKHQHEIGEMCPVEHHIQKQAHIVREYMKQNGI